jgi:hypothetical protein
LGARNLEVFKGIKSQFQVTTRARHRVYEEPGRGPGHFHSAAEAGLDRLLPFAFNVLQYEYERSIIIVHTSML